MAIHRKPSRAEAAGRDAAPAASACEISRAFVALPGNGGDLQIQNRTEVIGMTPIRVRSFSPYEPPGA